MERLRQAAVWIGWIAHSTGTTRTISRCLTSTRRPLGGVQAEWTLGPDEITLEVDLDRRSGYFHVLHVEDDAGEERNIEPGGESGWKELTGLISSMSEGGR